MTSAVAERPTEQSAGRSHGYARYKLDGCRCYTCGWAVASYNDAREHAMRRGTWQPYVDAEPARQHILMLKECGIGDRSIAALANLDRKRIRELLHGRPERGTPPPTRIRPTTAAAILGVELTLEVLPANLPVDATGTLRRLRALVAGGFPQAQLGQRIDVTPGNFWALMQQDQVSVRRALSVRALYAELWNADPADHGVTAQAASRARNQARANNWPSAGCWDDDTIDDPSTLPEWTGACGTSSGYDAHYYLRLLPVCPPCRAARNEQRRAARLSAAAGPTTPTTTEE